MFKQFGRVRPALWIGLGLGLMVAFASPARAMHIMEGLLYPITYMGNVFSPLWFFLRWCILRFVTATLHPITLDSLVFGTNTCICCTNLSKNL